MRDDKNNKCDTHNHHGLSLNDRHSLSSYSHHQEKTHSHLPDLFNLSSHNRAKKAIDFALTVKEKHFHVIVIGENRSGRVSSTLSHIKNHAKTMKAPNDWVYLNNFHETHKPLPFSLPNGMGRYLKKELGELIDNVNNFINQLLKSPSYLKVIETMNAQMQFEIDSKYKEISKNAESKGFKIEQSEQGVNIEPISGDHFSVDALAELREKLTNITLSINFMQQEVDSKIHILRKENIQKALEPIFTKFSKKFSQYLHHWIDCLKEDILENIDLFLNPEEYDSLNPFEKYSVNLFVDNTGVKHPLSVLIDNPTYEDIFGSIQYLTNQFNGAIETNFTMIKPGALHLAHGGFVVIRADALLKNPELWDYLKAALRDRQIQIHEKHRDNALPILDAPQPYPINLNVQVYLVASPEMYHLLLEYDPEFTTYFKIKAEIDPHMPKNNENVKVYHKLLSYYAKRNDNYSISKSGLNFLTEHASRLTGSLEKLTSQFEVILDILDQAIALGSHKKRLDIHALQKIYRMILKRYTRFEEDIFEKIQSKTIHIETTGKKIGQINGLTVISTGDHEFGLPSRITAQTYVGHDGVVNIERLTEMAGPILQKGTFILEGFLKGVFAQNFPLSCGCSITFEQAYSDVDGDSASLAELMAIISSLSEYPINQNIAVTGSIDQFGNVQAVGGVAEKIEGFFKICAMNGFSGKHGVIIPKTNAENLTLRSEVKNAIEQKHFHIYKISNYLEAMNILFSCDIPENPEISKENLIEQKVFKEAYLKLKKYHDVLKTKTP